MNDNRSLDLQNLRASGVTTSQHRHSTTDPTRRVQESTARRSLQCSIRNSSISREPIVSTDLQSSASSLHNRNITMLPFEYDLDENNVSEDDLHTNSTSETIIPNTAPTSQFPPSSVFQQHQVHWEGYVRKKGDWLPRWEERYLVLDGATLTYYNTKEEARSARNLRGKMMIVKVRPENYGKAHGFLIETKGHKHFHLCCATELEKDMWIEMMQAAIEQAAPFSSNASHSFVSLHHSIAPFDQSPATQSQPSGSDCSDPRTHLLVQVELRSFYVAFRKLLISHSASPQFFSKLSRDVVLCSNYAPTVPFWGEYHGLDGVLHFFSILYETVEFTAFFVTDIAQAQEGRTAVVAGRETMKNRENGRKFTQQWQHTLEFAPDGRVKSLTIQADPVAASAVFGCNATSSLSLPIAAVVGNSVQDNPAGTIHVTVYRGEQIGSPNVSLVSEKRLSGNSTTSLLEHCLNVDGDQVSPAVNSISRAEGFFLGLRLMVDGKTNVYAPTNSSTCLTRTRVSDRQEGFDPKWNSEHWLPFTGCSRGKPCFMLMEAWQVRTLNDVGDENLQVEELIGVAKVNLAPFLALGSSSQTVRDSVIHAEIARGAIPQWYTLLSANETRNSCGRVQLSIHFEAAKTQKIDEVDARASSSTDETAPSVQETSTCVEAQKPHENDSLSESGNASRISTRNFSFRDTRRDNHHFQVGNTKFDIPRRYQLIKAIGQGAYGCVIAASDTETGQALAIKNIPNAFNDLIDAKRILREIRLMRHLNHPNLVNLVDLIRPPSLQEFNDVYIVTDLMETDLHRVIHSNQSITDEHIQYFLYQMLVAIHYVHSAQVLHRDLKPSNILVNSDCDLKLCDFGLARGVNGMDSGLTEYVVTRWYRAPELLLSSKYDKQMDVWAIGCILAEMLGRRPLFPGHDYLHQLKIIMDVVGSPTEDCLDFITNPKAKRFILRQPKKPQVPLSSIYPRASGGCMDLLEKMLVFDPRKRITIEQALEHPYLSSLRDKNLEKTSATPFDFAFEDCDLTRIKLQELIFEDVCHFHPEASVWELSVHSISGRSPMKRPLNRKSFPGHVANTQGSAHSAPGPSTGSLARSMQAQSGNTQVALASSSTESSTESTDRQSKDRGGHKDAAVEKVTSVDVAPVL
uniref:Mitogen-activated protein kinase n=1 Tax=Albugo laibachii Nc14 TaxID=890382 RepID=F0WA53_9STRA|nr:mitogenactivated protein kinase putative [Albugo laibachii Nc14]|eukprot:CCA18023.1 mitogenactivated protein kinase putative [Albugo laibachii Nc14]